MDHFKFELIRASAAQEITHSRSAKFATESAAELVDAFINFALGCEYEREELADAFAKSIADAPQHHCLEAYWTGTPAPAGSLVERVRKAIKHEFDYDARAAIREVAAHIRANVSPGPSIAAGIAAWLEQEAGPTFSQED